MSTEVTITTDITEVVVNISNTEVVGTVQAPVDIISVGIQGPAGASGTSTLSGATDLDLTELGPGSILVYDDTTAKWVSTTKLEKQTVDCGQF